MKRWIGQGLEARMKGFERESAGYFRRRFSEGSHVFMHGSNIEWIRLEDLPVSMRNLRKLGKN